MDERTMWYDMGKIDKVKSPINTGVTNINVGMEFEVEVSGNTINENE